MNKNKKKLDYSKQIIADIRWLLWIVTVGCLVLSGISIWLGYLGTLPWLTGIVTLPWAAHGLVCQQYLSLAKVEHQKNGLTYDLAMMDKNKEDEPTI